MFYPRPKPQVDPADDLAAILAALEYWWGGE
jgi:hypothetical protein